MITPHYSMALYAIGDIHGCITALKTIFKEMAFEKGDTIVCLGDYIDRGPDARGVIKFLLEQEKVLDLVFMKGNHEIMMMDARSNQTELNFWLQFGGDQVLESYCIVDMRDWADWIDDEHWEFIERGESYVEIGDYIFVHAGLRPGIPLKHQAEHDLFWNKYVVPDQYKEGKTVICGHTSRKNGKVHDFGHTICIDTYAYGGQWLTCLNIETKAYLQANEDGETQSGKL